MTEYLDTSVVRVYYEIGSSISYYVTTLEDLLMAAAAGVANVELTSLERQWVMKSIDLQVASLKRSLTKEIVGSDIHRLRSKEINDLQSLVSKFGGV